MKKLLFFAVALLGFFGVVSKVNSQNTAFPTFEKGTNLLTVNLGLLDNFYISGFPPLTVSYERGMLNDVFKNESNVNLGLGAKFSFAHIEAVNIAFLAARGTAHHEFVESLDTYVGLDLGVIRASYGGAAFGRFGYNAFLGARYYFSPKFAVHLETGYGYTIFDLGLTYKF